LKESIYKYKMHHLIYQETANLAFVTPLYSLLFLVNKNKGTEFMIFREIKVGILLFNHEIDYNCQF